MVLFLGIINFFTKDYLQYKYIKNFNINNIDKDKLIVLCENNDLTIEATNRMVMKYVEHKTYGEIASIECVDENTIKQSIRRSRRKLNI